MDIVDIKTNYEESDTITVEARMKAATQIGAETRARSKTLTLYPTKALKANEIISIQTGQSYVAKEYRVLVVLGPAEQGIIPSGSQYPRSIDPYNFTRHASNRAKERGIQLTEIRTAISQGKIYTQDTFPEERVGKELRGEDIIAYATADMPIPLYIIADPPEDEIITLFYEDQAGAVDGSLLRRPR